MVCVKILDETVGSESEKEFVRSILEEVKKSSQKGYAKSQMIKELEEELDWLRSEFPEIFSLSHSHP